MDDTYYDSYLEEYLRSLMAPGEYLPDAPGGVPDQGGAAPYVPPQQGAPVQWGQINPPPNVDGGWSDEHTGGYVPENGGNPAGYMDLSYWASRGVPADQIFDFATGQTRPGWARTGRGYERTSTGGAGSGGTDGGGGAGAGGGGGGGDYFGQPPQLRSLNDLYPTWNPPPFGGAPPFSHPDFVRPSMEDAENEPGYAFAATQGRKGVEASKAAQGIYRSGQTLKDIYAWASEFAKQNYSGVFDRSLRTYDTNRNNAADTYMMNYGVSRDVFDRNYNAYVGGFDSRRRQAELDFARDWDLYANDQQNRRFVAGLGD